MNGENLLEQLSKAIGERDAARARVPDEGQLARAVAALETYEAFGQECEEAEYTDTGAAWEVMDALADCLADLTRAALSGEGGAK